ncbi:MAG: heme biosynthesis HemY N-terminal domain-containing protein [Pseudomonadales bacterium]|jgi:HemY protein|tara:strand:+ start:20603 stop:21739 length:1137 start_codon:yes stop_codon:yes gene_type:complete
MKRGLLLLLVIIAVAGYLGTLIARDPGYVLVAYDGYSIQTSLWVLIGLFLGFFLAAYLLFRSFNLFKYGRGVVVEWREAKKEARAGKLTQKGLTLLAEGEFDRARKFLDGAGENSDAEGINFLAVARAANNQGDHRARETYLRQAVEADPSLVRAASVLSAELALRRKDPAAALTALGSIKLNPYAAELKLQALKMSNDWRASMAALPGLRKLVPTESFENKIVLTALKAEAGDDAALNRLFRSLASSVRNSPEVLTQYVKSLSYKAHAEPLLRAAIKRSWDAAYVSLYGDADFDTLKVRRKAAEGWLKLHEKDPALHYCLGCLYELSNESHMAKESFTRSVELGGSVKSHERLGLLLAQNGELESSVQHLKLALSLD